MDQPCQSVFGQENFRISPNQSFNPRLNNFRLRPHLPILSVQTSKIQKLLGETRQAIMLGDQNECRPSRAALPPPKQVPSLPKAPLMVQKLNTTNEVPRKPLRLQKDSKTCTPQHLLIIKQSEMTAAEDKLLLRKRLNSIGATRTAGAKQKLYRTSSPPRKRPLTLPIREAMKDKDWLSRARDQIVKEFNTMLLSSNGLTVQPSTGYFKYYVGRGNNSGLIKQLMASRWWWVQVKEEEKDSAHFVWSQWRDKDLLKRLPAQTPPETASKGEVTVSCTTRCSTYPEGSAFPVQHKVDLAGLNFDLITRSDCYAQVPVQSVNPTQLQLLNKLSCNHELANKKSLYYSMKEFYGGEFKSIPQTFHVASAEGANFREFEAVYHSGLRYWIVKPGEYSNQGQGITVTNDLAVIRREVSASKHTFVIQKYIEKPFLVHRRKFDIRCFALVTIINGVVQAYFYQEGYLRTATREFTLDKLDNRFVHLTNDAVQKKSANYGKHESANKLSYQDFQRYLDATGHDVDFTLDILPRIKDIVQDSIKATYTRLDPELKGHTFEVFGYDFLLDHALKPWLLEINTNPCLDLASPHLARIIPAMLENSLKLALDPLFPEPSNQRRANDSLTENKYELIFHSLAC